jgi:hypothetical protein
LVFSCRLYRIINHSLLLLTMDCYIIPPVKNLELANEGDRFFCLAQLYKKYDFYRHFFKQKVANKDWVTLDNGAGDHDIVTKNELFEIMADLKPSEVIPPDFIGDGVKTIMSLEDFVRSMRDAGHLKTIQVLGCPQGNSKADWLFTYRYMLAHSHVNTIGLSKISATKLFYEGASSMSTDLYVKQGRQECFYHLLNNNLLKKPIHFLGMGNPIEFDTYFESVQRISELREILRSTDSCNTVWSGMNKRLFEKGEFDRVPTPKDYFEKEMSQEDILRARLNISWFRKQLGKNKEKVATN